MRAVLTIRLSAVSTFRAFPPHEIRPNAVLIADDRDMV